MLRRLTMSTAQVASRSSYFATGAKEAASRVKPALGTVVTGHSSRSKSTAASGVTEPPHELFHPWGVKRIEATGDYRQDKWLEDHIGGPLYEKQKMIPRLPVPEISDTLQRALPTILPMCENQEEVDQLKQAISDFPRQAESLQRGLQARANHPDWKDSSWLQYWWNKAGYLQVRDTVVINVSYFFDLSDDPTVYNSNNPMIQRGASFLTATAQFRQSICSGSRPQDMVGRGDKAKPLCSVAYKYLFHACRIPRLEEDTYRVYDPSLYHHAVVVRKGHFFKLDFCDPQSGKPYPLPVLEQALQVIVEQADRLEAEHGTTLPKLGWLTTQNRDDWAKGRTALIEYGGPAMEAALEVLESGAVCLCLDDEAPVSRQETAPLYLHGGMSAGGNRWFDKSVQLIVCNNGKAGFVGEHSMMDGMPVVPLADHLTKVSYEQCRTNTDVAAPATTNPRDLIEPIFASALFPAMERAGDLVQQAQHSHADWTGQHDMRCQTFLAYGGQFIKESGFSPDAFVQMAMQMATFRLWGKQGGTYEATQVRPFLHGRTETTRSVSTQSAALCQAMGLQPKFDEFRNPKSRDEKLDLLNQACMAHVKYINLAAQAQGVDRHFLGLSMIGSESQQPLPDLYQHPAYIRAKSWRVSTSHLMHPAFENWGYGEVRPDGVGLSYNIQPRHIVFNCTALRIHGWTDKLMQLLQESLLELQRLVEAKQAADNSTPKSKL